MSGPSIARRAVLPLLRDKPIIGVVRTHDRALAGSEARRLLDSGLGWVEITFTVPDAPGLVSELRSHPRLRSGEAALGMGTVTTPERAALAIAVEADFVVTPNASAAVAELVRRAGVPLVMGALTPTEIVEAHRLGADLVKVYPLPPVGGAAYLRTIRGPLDDIPMLAAGGFTAAEIPQYRDAGAVAFGLASSLLTDVDSALVLARGHEESEEAR